MSNEAQKLAFVVDDEKDWLEMHQEALEEAGYEVVPFKKIDAMLEYMGCDLKKSQLEVTKNLPALIVTDGDTGFGCDGLEVVDATKGKGIGVVVVSGAKNLYNTFSTSNKYQNTSAQFISKFEYGETSLVDIAQKSIEAAMMEKLGLKQDPGGRGVEPK